MRWAVCGVRWAVCGVRFVGARLMARLEGLLGGRIWEGKGGFVGRRGVLMDEKRRGMGDWNRGGFDGREGGEVVDVKGSSGRKHFSYIDILDELLGKRMARP